MDQEKRHQRQQQESEPVEEPGADDPAHPVTRSRDQPCRRHLPEDAHQRRAVGDGADQQAGCAQTHLVYGGKLIIVPHATPNHPISHTRWRTLASVCSGSAAGRAHGGGRGSERIQTGWQRTESCLNWKSNCEWRRAGKGQDERPTSPALISVFDYESPR